MKTFDSQGRLVGEITTTFTQDGKVITTNTIYNANNGQPIAQTHFHPRFAGAGHHAEHHWRKVAAIGGTDALLLGLSRFPHHAATVLRKTRPSVLPGASAGN